MPQRQVDQYLTKGDIECDCGNEWHYETLGDFLTCGKCRKRHRAEGEKVLYQPEIIEEEIEEPIEG